MIYMLFFSIASLLNTAYCLITFQSGYVTTFYKWITRSDFTVKVQLPYSTRYNGIEFRYNAFDDLRRKVISRFNQFNPINGILTISHSNPNFVIGIVSLTSIEYQGSFNYQIHVQEVTDTDCSISMSLSSTITQIGYQILLGTKDAFYIKGTIQTTSFPSYVQSFNFETGWENSQLLAYFQGISYIQGITFRLRLKRDNYVDSQTSYQIELWAGSVLQQVYHQYGAIRTQWDEGFYQSFRLYKIFLSKNYDVNIENILNSFELIIPELNFSTKIQGIFNFDISTSIKDLTLIFTRKCQQGKKLIMQVVPKNDCDSPYYQYDIHCDFKHNIYHQKLYFQTSTPLISKLKIEIMDIQLKIVHNYIDQVEKFVEIANIEYV